MKPVLCLTIALLAVCSGYAADNEYDTVDVYNVVTIRSSPIVEMRSELVLAQNQKEPNAYLVFFFCIHICSAGRWGGDQSTTHDDPAMAGNDPSSGPIFRDVDPFSE